jgi:hypothetical protein
MSAKRGIKYFINRMESHIIPPPQKNKQNEKYNQHKNYNYPLHAYGWI